MTGTTISSYTTTNLVLTQASQNPVTITATGTINTSGSNAVYGSAGTAWSITNNGSLAGATGGIELEGGGSVTNGSRSATTASISGYREGVLIQGGLGTVINDGAITGTATSVTSYGICLSSGGVVINGSSGVTNASISSAAYTSYGVFISGAVGTVTNHGTITSRYAGTRFPGFHSTGVFFGDGGVVTNGSSADTAAYILGGVVLGGTGSVTNFGGIGHVDLYSGGSVTNGSNTDISAFISGGGDFYVGPAVSIEGSPGHVLNYGGISRSYLGLDAEYGTGVGLGAGGTVINGDATDTRAVISGYDLGVGISGGAGTIMNYGTIGSESAEAILLGAGGSIVNGSGSDTTALIGYGFYIFGSAGTVTNSGSINSGRQGGIHLDAGGKVTNFVTGRIDGIVVTGLYATIANAGTITYSYGDGVDLAAGGVVANQQTGVIAGATGVGATTVSAIIANSGSISGSSGNGIYLGAGGLVTNAVGARISGTKNGVSLRGFGTVSNAGTITATVGVFLAAGGYVTNSAHGLIKGSAVGVLVSGGNVTVTKAATISGANYSVEFKGSGSDTLIVDPGAVFLGLVNGTSATSRPPFSGCRPPSARRWPALSRPTPSTSAGSSKQPTPLSVIPSRSTAQAAASRTSTLPRHTRPRTSPSRPIITAAPTSPSYESV